jgi:Family of unknown function (DUF6150)
MTRIYESPTPKDAQVRVALVTDKGQADLLVYRVQTWDSSHGGAFWFLTRSKQEAQVCVYFCSLGMAELKVCFVNSPSEAGWVNPTHPLALGILRHD